MNSFKSSSKAITFVFQEEISTNTSITTDVGWFTCIKTQFSLVHILRFQHMRWWYVSTFTIAKVFYASQKSITSKKIRFPCLKDYAVCLTRFYDVRHEEAQLLSFITGLLQIQLQVHLQAYFYMDSYSNVLLQITSSFRLDSVYFSVVVGSVWFFAVKHWSGIVKLKWALGS